MPKTDSENKRDGEPTYRLNIRYENLYYRDGVLLKEPPNMVAERIECGLKALAHIEALCRMMGLINRDALARLFEAFPASASEMLENLSELGALICSEAYGHIAEIPYDLEKQGENLDEKAA